MIYSPSRWKLTVIEIKEIVLSVVVFLISDVIKCVPDDSCIYLGHEKFISPRRCLPGVGGEGLSGPCATSSRAQEVDAEREWQHGMQQLRQETDFQWMMRYDFFFF